jgi:hypothetical protein
MMTLQIHINSLSGTLPASLSSCTALGHIQVQNNFLSGEMALRMVAEVFMKHVVLDAAVS